MTRAPRTIAPDALVAEALELISRKISALLVVEDGQVVGIVHFHDLLRVGAASAPASPASADSRSRIRRSCVGRQPMAKAAAFALARRLLATERNAAVAQW